MELELSGAIFQITHNAYDFKADNGQQLAGTAHHVYVLDFGDQKNADLDGSERKFVDVRVTTEQLTQLGLSKDSEVDWLCAVRPNGAKLRIDLVRPLAKLAAAKTS